MNKYFENEALLWSLKYSIRIKLGVKISFSLCVVDSKLLLLLLQDHCELIAPLTSVSR